MAAILQHHMGGSTYWTYNNMLLQLRVPDRFLGHVFALDFALFTLAMALSVWICGLILDNTNLDPRQLSFLLAIGSLLPLLPWVWLNRSDWRPHLETQPINHRFDQILERVAHLDPSIVWLLTRIL